MNAMKILKDKLSVIDDVIPPGSKIVFLDLPLFLNVGDLLIYKGTKQFFKERKYNVLAQRTDKSSLKYVSETKSLPRDVVIVLQGGGSFGDLYIHHQRLREQVILNFPDHKIVILPITVHFKEQSELARSAQIFKKHRDLTIFCRDSSSHLILKENFCSNSLMCPDMAHSLWDTFPKQNKANIKNDTLWMIRKDIEETNLSGLDGLPNPDEFKDWDDICTRTDKNVMKLLDQLERFNKLITSGLVPTPTLWDKYTDGLIERINEYFLTFDTVVTSRMHSHILCCLLGVKTKLLDNSYGKNSTYYKAWTESVAYCELIKL